MSADLLSYLVTPDAMRGALSDTVVGAARDLMAVRAIAKKADEGNPGALAFVRQAQEQLAQAKVRRERANRLRAGSAKASMMGYHQLARMGAEAAMEEQNEAEATEANVIAAINASHSSDQLGYYSPEEERLLKRKSFEESLTAGQREDVMSKLLGRMYDSSFGFYSPEEERLLKRKSFEESLTASGVEDVMSKLTGKLYETTGTMMAPDAMGAETADFVSFLHAATEAYGADLDSVFGEDAVSDVAAAFGASAARIKKRIAKLKQKLAAVEEKLDSAGGLRAKMLARKKRRIQARLKKLMAQTRKTVKAKKSAENAEDDTAEVESREEESVEKAAESDSDDATEGDFGAILGKKARIQRIKKRIAKLQAALENTDNEKKSAKLEKRIAKLKAKLRGLGAGDEDEDTSTSSTSEDGQIVKAATPPSAFDEKGYLDSYKGDTRQRREMVGFFERRAAAYGLDAAPSSMLEDDAFAGFFSAIGEFFRNIFTVGKRDTGRIRSASREARAARKAKAAEVGLPTMKKEALEIRMKRLKYMFSKADTPAQRAELQSKMDALRPKLRAARADVRAAGKAAFEKSFEASRPGESMRVVTVNDGKVPADYPIQGVPLLLMGSKGEQVKAVQTFLNQIEGANLPVTGNFAKMTDAAVRKFQSKNALKVDGKVGTSTAAVMYKIDGGNVKFGGSSDLESLEAEVDALLGGF